MTDVARDTRTPRKTLGMYPRVNIECIEDYVDLRRQPTPEDKAGGEAVRKDPTYRFRLHLEIAFDKKRLFKEMVLALEADDAATALAKIKEQVGAPDPADEDALRAHRILDAAFTVPPTTGR